MFTDPVKNIKIVGLREDDVVVDLGAGTGFYSVAAGHIVTRGKVYAVEIVKDFLATIKNKVKEANLHNVEIIWGDVEKRGGTSIGDSVADVAIASNILFQVKDKTQFIDEIKRILKPKGKVLLIEWSQGSLVVGQNSVIPKNQAREMFEKRGFMFGRDIDAEAHHYGMIFIKS